MSHTGVLVWISGMKFSVSKCDFSTSVFIFKYKTVQSKFVSGDLESQFSNEKLNLRQCNDVVALQLGGLENRGLPPPEFWPRCQRYDHPVLNGSIWNYVTLWWRHHAGFVWTGSKARRRVDCSANETGPSPTSFRKVRYIWFFSRWRVSKRKEVHQQWW